MKLISMIFVLTVGANAFAVEPGRCPAVVPFKGEVTKVYQSSIYSKTPGWKEAQQSLAAVGPMEIEFTLVKRTADACFYKDESGNSAKLSSFAFNDPEEYVDPVTDMFSVSLKIDNSKYVTFIPLESYSSQGLVTYGNPFSLKIKASLKSQATNKLATYDMGMISVSLK